jgi:hypothetical protein
VKRLIGDEYALRGKLCGFALFAICLLLVSCLFVAFAVPIKQNINVNGSYKNEPAPMGIVDYGVSQSGPYKYVASSMLGVINIKSLSVQTEQIGSAVAIFQLNVNFEFSVGGKQYVYWVQNVAFINTAGNTFDNLVVNVWNSSAPSALLDGGSVKGQGSVVPDGSIYYYSYKALSGHQSVRLTYPETIKLGLFSVLNGNGEPKLIFMYDYGSGQVSYDSVTFATSSNASAIGFVVDGFHYTPRGNYYNAELVLCGQRGGSQVNVVSADVQLQLEFWNGYNFQQVTNAYNYGSDTGETIGNVICQTYFESDGKVYAEVSPGAGSLGELYDESQIGVINVTAPVGSGILEVASTSDPSVAEDYPFSNQAILTLYPGNYTIRLFQNSRLYEETDVQITAGYQLNRQVPFSGQQPPALPIMHSSGSSNFTIGSIFENQYLIVVSIIAVIVVVAVAGAFLLKKSRSQRRNV